jgi:chromosome segregation ATPase
LLSILRTKDTEIQHLITRIEHQKKIAENEAQKSRQLSSQVSTFSQTETELRSQLNIYVEKFKQVEDTLNNSNDLFLTFRKEMEDMSKKTKRLEKENVNLTRKQELTNRNILEMAEERTKIQKENESLKKKNATLESLVRRMQNQGRGAGLTNGVEVDDDITESEYAPSEEDDEYDPPSEGEYEEDDTEEDMAMQAGLAPGQYGPVPPPPPPPQPESNSMNGHLNGNSQRVIEL